MIKTFMTKGCTLLNESMNHVINGYANKKRYSGPLGYRGAVARGVSQWNEPFQHLQSELYTFSVNLPNAHTKEMERTHDKLLKNRAYSVSRERYLKKKTEKVETPNSSVFIHW